MVLNLYQNFDFPMDYFPEVLPTVTEGNEKEEDIFWRTQPFCEMPSAEKRASINKSCTWLQNSSLH